MTPEPAIDWSAQPALFRSYHEPVLERDEVRHGLILSALAQVNSGKPIDLRRWTFGEPGECVIKMGHHAMLECAALRVAARVLRPAPCVPLTALSPVLRGSRRDEGRCDNTAPAARRTKGREGSRLWF